MAAVLSWASKPARFVPDSFAIASRAALPLSDWSFIRAMVSYQIPTSGLAEIGVVLQRFGFDDEQILSFAGDLAGVVYQRGTRISLHFQKLRVPGYHRGGIWRLRG